jgi:hypothetical protein
LDVYGDKTEWGRGLEAACSADAGIEKAVVKLEQDKAENPENFVSLTAIQKVTAPESNSEAVETK